MATRRVDVDPWSGPATHDEFNHVSSFRTRVHLSTHVTKLTVLFGLYSTPR